MVAKTPPIKLKYARVMFRLIFDAVEIAEVELTSHFVQRQRERDIDLVDVNNVMKMGHIKSEYKPDKDHSEWRWSLCYKDLTIIFNLNVVDQQIVFITCWRGKEPPEGDR